MNFLLQILFLLLTCLTQASPIVASSNNAIPTFSTQATQKVESEETKEVLHFARSSIEENIVQQTTSHFSSSKQSPTFLKDAFQNFGGLHLEESLSKSWGASQHFSTKEQLSLVENRARERSDKFVNGAGKFSVPLFGASLAIA